MTKIEKWVRDLTEEVLGGPPFKVEDTVKHPDGRTVKIVGGQYWGTYGLSNYWEWRELKADGSLSEKLEEGYGWFNDSHRTLDEVGAGGTGTG